MKKLLLIIGFIVCGTLVGSNQIFAAPCDPVNGRIQVVATGNPSVNCMSIKTAASKANGADPLLIEVLPGTYNEDSIVLKNYVRLKGSGVNNTTINSPSSDIIQAHNVQGVEISDFTFDTSVSGNNFTGVWNKNSNTIIRNNRFNNLKWGVYDEIAASKPAVIKGNEFFGSMSAIIGIEIYNTKSIIVGNYFKDLPNQAIYGSGSNVIKDNVIEAADQSNGIELVSTGNTVISGNIINGAGTSCCAGIEISGPGVTITNNKVVNHRYADIYAGSGHNISFNVFSSFNGFTPSNLNVKPNGASH